MSTPTKTEYIQMPAISTPAIVNHLHALPEGKEKNTLRLQYLMRYLSTYREAPDIKTLTNDVLYALGVVTDPVNFTGAIGLTEYKNFLKENHLS
jgi:hypothetical protein